MSTQHEGPPGAPFYNVSREQATKTLFYFVAFVFSFFISSVSIALATLFRTDFGQRYYTVFKAFISFLFMAMIANAFLSDPSLNAGGVGGVQLQPYVAGIIALVSISHFWRIWVNNKLGMYVHSYYDGRSRFEPIAEWVASRPANPLLQAIVNGLGAISLSKEEQHFLRNAMTAVPSIKDTDRFAKMWLEPIFGLILSLMLLSDGILSTWLLISSVCLFITSSIILKGRKSAQLDLADSMVEAQSQKYAINLDALLAAQRNKPREVKAEKEVPVPLVVKPKVTTAPIQPLEQGKGSLPERKSDIFTALEDIGIDID